MEKILFCYCQNTLAGCTILVHYKEDGDGGMRCYPAVEPTEPSRSDLSRHAGE